MLSSNFFAVTASIHVLMLSAADLFQFRKQPFPINRSKGLL